ncbi:hypothetical protein PORY_000435 [Pneumocystis oryctolagi]|uniref:Uncharacterized protein n=1 Tax=Pneumocystis oryctolagi TaxID=42067 RepID=A0ACB7CHP7_9ASCO|nr:hypothetical protein PORY_000435 [Pneumocystis oryctolagi]
MKLHKEEKTQESPRKKQRTQSTLSQDADCIQETKQFWLMKAEPESRLVRGQDGKFIYKNNTRWMSAIVKFSIDDLEKMQVSPWDGVRNAEACKTMRYRMKVGDHAFFYHSNCETPGIAGWLLGIMEINKEGYPDDTAWDSSHPYYDPRSTRENPRWYMVDVKYLRHLSRFIPLRELKKYKDGPLKNMALLNRPRLSVQPVTIDEWNFIMELEKKSID